MIEAVCAELLLTGLLKASAGRTEFDKNNVLHIHRDNTAYMIADSKSIASVKCNSHKLSENLSGQMNLFIKK